MFRTHLAALLPHSVLAPALLSAPLVAAAQEADPLPTKKVMSYANTFNREFTPGTGFSLINTKRGSLNISAYGLYRYMNQYAVGDSFTDHLAVQQLLEAVPEAKRLARLSCVRPTRVTTGKIGRNVEVKDDSLHLVASLAKNLQKARVLLRLALLRTTDLATIQRYVDEY
jgi:hypothetical protein